MAIMKMQPKAGDNVHLNTLIIRGMSEVQTPRVDTCPTCDSSKIEIDTAPTEVVKDLAMQKLDFHHKQAEVARKLTNNDEADSRCHNSDVRVFQFDLQQQMYLPTLTHTQMYYSRQLAFVNMGIHLEDEGKGIMFLRNEIVRQRGSNEIASCLYKFFTFSEIGYTTDKKKLILWADNWWTKQEPSCTCYVPRFNCKRFLFRNYS
ncbi:unnamed protein product [Parnassius apollo]|uniref:(apollo) hypothetical protein n=1 Tax=Parnassius apollo TaxID=110799 RepID=A0A8S3XII5_PARAO|nr:unnamed protein product [Parnassius apollo]